MVHSQFSRYRVETSQVRQRLHTEVVERLMILLYHQRVGIKGLTTQKTLIQGAFAHFSRYRVETSQVGQRLHGTGRGEVDDSTVPPEVLGIKAWSLKKT